MNHLQNILSQRDYSGSPEDEYSQAIDTFYTHSQIEGKEQEFLKLLEKSVQENKKITLDPKFEEEMDGILYDTIPFERLILV